MRLFTALRVLPDPLPEVWFVDLLHLPTETTAAYDLARLRGAPCACSSAGPGGLSPRARRGPTLRCSRAWPSCDAAARLRGSDALAVIGAGDVLPAAEYNRLLERLLEEEHDAVPASRRVYVTGSEHVSPDLYRASRARGCTSSARTPAASTARTSARRTPRGRSRSSVPISSSPGSAPATTRSPGAFPRCAGALDVELVVEHE